MKGPFFVKNEEGKYQPADICGECAWFSDKREDCIMIKCPFMPECEREENED